MTVRSETRSWKKGPKGATVTRLVEDDVVLSWVSVARRLVSCAQTREVWNAAWAELPDAMWKPVPIHPSTVQRPCFVVCVPSRYRSSDSSAFRAQIRAADPTALVLSFPNLSGRSTLIVPRETGPWSHLRPFCTSAPPAERHALWRAVGAHAAAAIAEERPVWCNVHGHGVPWLHIRFDDHHKYCAFPPSGPITPASQAVWWRIYEGTFP